MTKSDWFTLEPPQLRAELGYEFIFSKTDAQCLRTGLYPEEMEDKWFVYFEDGWLHFHRSWTGVLVYWLKLESSPNGVQVVESWVNRDSEQYGETDCAYDCMLLDFLLRGMLLRQEVPFPIPETLHEGRGAGVYQHHIVGQQYPERIVRYAVNKTERKEK